MRSTSTRSGSDPRRRSGRDPRPRRASGPRPPGACEARVRAAFTRSSAATLLLLLLASCGGEEAGLRVDGVSFSEDELLGLSAERRGRLAEITALGLAFARDAVDRLGAPLVERRRDELLLERFRASLALDRSNVEDDVLRAQYRTDPRYELVVRHVVALAAAQDPDSVHRAARARAERALERIEAGEPTAEVAADLSEEPGAAERGGRLEPGRVGSWVPEFWRAADGLDEGEQTGVVQTPFGYHVIELEERRMVPFEEMRSEAVLEGGRMLGGMDEAWTAWSDSVAASIRIDTAAVQRWREGAGRTIDTLALEEQAGGDGEVLARSGADGSGRSYTVGDFRRHLVALEEDRWRRIAGGSMDEAVAAVRSESLRNAGLAEARERGLRVAGSEEERLAREWRSQVASWAASLGFRPGLQAVAVKERALEVLATTRQNASITRRELEPRALLLRAAYSIRGLDRETGGS